MSRQANKMAIQEKNQAAENIEAEENNLQGELTQPVWSVITFETIAAGNLSYDEAARLLEELSKQKVSGLCIITDEAAARFTK